MADTIQRVEYFYAQVPNKAGEGSRFLTALHVARWNLLAFSGFPEGRGSQLDFVPADPAAFKQFARTATGVVRVWETIPAGASTTRGSSPRSRSSASGLSAPRVLGSGAVVDEVEAHARMVSGLDVAVERAGWEGSGVVVRARRRRRRRSPATGAGLEARRAARPRAPADRRQRPGGPLRPRPPAGRPGCSPAPARPPMSRPRWRCWPERPSGRSTGGAVPTPRASTTKDRLTI